MGLVPRQPVDFVAVSETANDRRRGVLEVAVNPKNRFRLGLRFYRAFGLLLEPVSEIVAGEDLRDGGVVVVIVGGGVVILIGLLKFDRPYYGDSGDVEIAT